MTADGYARELTRAERNAIRNLTVGMCANYDREYGCLPLENPCYMLAKRWTGAYCIYFCNAVLPNDRALEDALKGGAFSGTRRCALCGTVFLADGKRAYCSNACAGAALRKQKREYIRKIRGRA